MVIEVEMNLKGGDGVMKYLRINLTIFGIQLDSSYSSQHDLLNLLI